MNIFAIVSFYNTLYNLSLNYSLTGEQVKEFKAAFLSAFPGELNAERRASARTIRENLDAACYKAQGMSDRTYYFESCRAALIELINSYGN